VLTSESVFVCDILSSLVLQLIGVRLIPLSFHLVHGQNNICRIDCCTTVFSSYSVFMSWLVLYTKKFCDNGRSCACLLRLIFIITRVQSETAVITQACDRYASLLSSSVECNKHQLLVMMSLQNPQGFL